LVFIALLLFAEDISNPYANRQISISVLWIDCNALCGMDIAGQALLEEAGEAAKPI